MLNNVSICPVCDAHIHIPKNTEISEIINCSDCTSRLVVKNIKNNLAVLQQAPEIEEDWGE